MARLEIRDDFVVHRSESFARTVDYLKAVDGQLRKQLARETVSQVMNSESVAAYADIINSIDVRVSHWHMREKVNTYRDCD